MLKQMLYDFYVLKIQKKNIVELKNKFRNITFVIKTFERPEAIKRLLQSIDKYYGLLGNDLKIYIVDDSKEPHCPDNKLRNAIEYFTIDFDSGVSIGRNYALSKTKTKYFLLLDDDFVFTRETDIEKLYDIIEKEIDIDLLAGSVYNKGKKRVNSECCVSLDNGILTRSKNPKKEINGIKYYDFVVNFFIANTEKIKNIRWDDELKIVEHTAFFLKSKNKGLGVALYGDVRVNHYPLKNKHYSKFRTNRVDEYIELAHKKYGIKEIVELNK